MNVNIKNGFIKKIKKNSLIIFLKLLIMKKIRKYKIKFVRNKYLYLEILGKIFKVLIYKFKIKE